jgi:hypothetical protein
MPDTIQRLRCAPARSGTAIAQGNDNTRGEAHEVPGQCGVATRCGLHFTYATTLGCRDGTRRRRISPRLP